MIEQRPFFLAFLQVLIVSVVRGGHPNTTGSSSEAKSPDRLPNHGNVVLEKIMVFKVLTCACLNAPAKVYGVEWLCWSITIVWCQAVRGQSDAHQIINMHCYMSRISGIIVATSAGVDCSEGGLADMFGRWKLKQPCAPPWARY